MLLYYALPPNRAFSGLLMPSFLIVFLDQVFPKIAIKFSPNGMDMVAVVLGIVVFDQIFPPINIVYLEFWVNFG